MNGALAGQSIAAQPGQPLIIMLFSLTAGHSPSKNGRSSEGPMPGHPRGSACAPLGGVRLSVIESEPAAWLNDVDGRDKPGMTVRAMVRNSQ
jgi:hypothetical protein